MRRTFSHPIQFNLRKNRHRFIASTHFPFHHTNERMMDCRIHVEINQWKSLMLAHNYVYYYWRHKHAQ